MHQSIHSAQSVRATSLYLDNAASVTITTTTRPFGHDFNETLAAMECNSAITFYFGRTSEGYSKAIALFTANGGKPSEVVERKMIEGWEKMEPAIFFDRLARLFHETKGCD